MRASVAVAAALLGGIAVFAMTAGLAGSWVVGLAIGLAVAGGLGAWCWARPFMALDGTAASRGLRVVSAIAALVALVMLGRLSVFMADSSRPEFSLVPGSAWEMNHSCLTAYYVAAGVVDAGGDPYDAKHYNAPEDDARSQRKPLWLGPFRIDVYEYPPSFLLLPRAILAATRDFDRLRTFWFGLNVAVIAIAIAAVARRLGPVVGTRALLLSPLVWAAPCTLGLLQKGNVQGLIVAISILAMILLESRRRAVGAAGGALLAFATVSKLYPGLLVAYLLVRRRWHALAWTAAFGVAYVAATFAYAGTTPLLSFLQHLPRLLGGEAFAFFRNPMAMATNDSVPGMAFKLGLLGVPGMGFTASKAIGWAWTLVMLWLVARLGRRMLCAEEEPLVWLAIVVLATLRSPYLPQSYAGVPPIWLLTLVAAHHAPTARTLALTLMCWAPMAAFWPNDWRSVDVRVFLALGLVPFAIMVVLPIRTLWRAPAPARRALPAAAPARSPAA